MTTPAHVQRHLRVLEDIARSYGEDSENGQALRFAIECVKGGDEPVAWIPAAMIDPRTQEDLFTANRFRVSDNSVPVYASPVVTAKPHDNNGDVIGAEVTLSAATPPIAAGGVDALQAVREVREAELFEDGCEADLHDAGVTTLPAAYMAGRQDALDEVEDALFQGGSDHER